jgi:hypothetical protein
MQKNSDGYFYSRKCKQDYGGVCKSAFCRSLESGSWFYVGAFGRNLASVAMKVFSYLIYKEIFKHSSGHLHVCQFNAHHSAEWLIIIIIII